MSAYPIIILHKGNHDYLKVCIKQAKYSNPSSRIILIGDNSNKKCALNEGVEHYLISDYFKSALEFAKNYKHYSTNNYNYELFCFQRWFIIKDFIDSQGIDKFIHIDSDVLLFKNFYSDTSYLNTIKKYDFLHCGYSAHTSVFNSKDVLLYFCDFINKMFLDKNFVTQFETKMNSDKIIYKVNNAIYYANPPLSDMCAVKFFALRDDVKSLDLSSTILDDGIMCNNFDANINFASFGRVSYVVYDNNNQPFFVSNNTSPLAFIKAHSLHFQDQKKRLISLYSTYDKDGQIKTPAFSDRDLSYIFNVQIVKIKKSLFMKIASALAKFLIPSKELRIKIRERLTGQIYFG